MDIHLEAIAGLPVRTADGVARQAALEGLGENRLGTAGWVEYRSHGLTLIVGPAAAALAAARAIGDGLDCAVVAEPDGSDPDSDAERYVIARRRPDRLSGYLGAFLAELDDNAQTYNLAALARRGRERFDLVLDLGETPMLSVEKPPPGYFRSRGDPEALASALESLPGLVGEFQKPRFFEYQEGLCAHGSRGITGCTRCLEACATGAIHSLGELVEVDPYLCQGCGSCATVCPSGAMGYAYPSREDFLGAMRRLLATFRETGEGAPALLLHDGETGAVAVEAAATGLPEWVLPVPVEDAGAVGMEQLLALLALGAAEVVVLLPQRAEASLRRATLSQLDYLREVLRCLAIEPKRVRVVDETTLAAPIDWPRVEAPVSKSPGRFSLSGGKRAVFHAALAHLTAQRMPASPVPMPAGAPFGRIAVDRDACTLCMACVAVCPTEAVTSGGSTPKLLFREDRCVQCGLCETACPEDAIRLEPRLSVPDQLLAEETVLNEETPFHCVACGKAFATERMIGHIAAKLQGHWMFQDERSRRRLQMCDECRVRDAMSEEING